MSFFSAIRAWFINPEPCAPSPAPDASKRRKRRPRTTDPISFKTLDIGDNMLISNISRRDIISRVGNANRYYSDRKFTFGWDSENDTAVVTRIA